MFKPITVEDCQFTLTVETEYMPVRGNVQKSGDFAADREAENEILERLQDGDEWAWCWVTVRASFCGLDTRKSRVACTARNKHDFLQGSTYRSIQEECVMDLNHWLTNLYERIHQP